ncbi:hypothetical protein NQZ68_029164 [Dissostichus eleginoides]|nr:hypothetical protein NQZ68_029164 [Dissostichus eleginoides]
MPAKVIVEMLDDGDGWDRMRHGSSEITPFSHIGTAAISALRPSSLLAPGPAGPPGGLGGSGEISRLDDKQRPKDERGDSHTAVLSDLTNRPAVIKDILSYVSQQSMKEQHQKQLLLTLAEPELLDNAEELET